MFVRFSLRKHGTCRIFFISFMVQAVLLLYTNYFGCTSDSNRILFLFERNALIMLVVVVQFNESSVRNCLLVYFICTLYLVFIYSFYPVLTFVQGYPEEFVQILEQKMFLLPRFRGFCALNITTVLQKKRASFLENQLQIR